MSLFLVEALGQVNLEDFREHLDKHFTDTFSRIGLPKPYGSQP